MISITAAVPADGDAMAAILSDWIDTTDWMPRIHTRGEDRGFCAHLIATQDVQVARGPSVLGFLSRDGRMITALYLAPGARGQGIGRRLLETAMAGAGPLTLWTFAANTGARRFYERAGFAEVARTDGQNEERLPDVQMIWSAGQTAHG